MKKAQSHIPIKISAISARQSFEGCSKEYILNTCKGKCCGTKQTKEGCAVWVQPSGINAIEKTGAIVRDGWLQPINDGEGCPFHSSDGLCSIHTTGAKPLGCWLSPFTLNKRNTLIIKNRNRMFSCYQDKLITKTSAYIAYRKSLVFMFGESETARITAHLNNGGGDLLAQMPLRTFHEIRMGIDAHHIRRTNKQDKRKFKLSLSGDQT